jgi:hypothetical protein
MYIENNFVLINLDQMIYLLWGITLATHNLTIKSVILLSNQAL